MDIVVVVLEVVVVLSSATGSIGLTITFSDEDSELHAIKINANNNLCYLKISLSIFI